MATETERLSVMSVPQRTRPARRPSLRDRAYEEIKRQIITCELKPGEPVTITDLAATLEIGRTPVIQAIDRLTVDGLVEVMPRKGVVVSPVSIDDLVEILEVRLLNETAAVRWAAERASRSDIINLEANLDATVDAAKRRDVEEMIENDRDFHRLISAATDNKVIAEFLSNLHDRSIRFWFISLRTPDHDLRVCEQHAAIVEAIRQRNPDAAETALRQHIQAFRHNILEQLVHK